MIIPLFTFELISTTNQPTSWSPAIPKSLKSQKSHAPFLFPELVLAAVSYKGIFFLPLVSYLSRIYHPCVNLQECNQWHQLSVVFLLVSNSTCLYLALLLNRFCSWGSKTTTVSPSLTYFIAVLLWELQQKSQGKLWLAHLRSVHSLEPMSVAMGMKNFHSC